MVDTAINLRNTVFLNSKSAEDIWQALLEFWAIVYTVLPESIRLDRQCTLVSEKIQKIQKIQKIYRNRPQLSGIESNKAIGKRKR